MNSLLRVLDFLAAPKCAFWSILTSAIWFYAGALLAKSAAYRQAFRQFSDQPIPAWLGTEAGANPMVLTWFLGLCLIGGLLGASSFAYVIRNWRRPTQAGRPNRKPTLLLLHLLFGLIMLCHLGDMTSGDKSNSLRLLPGQRADFGTDLQVQVENVTFTDDLILLQGNPKAVRHLFTRDRYHRDQNRATLTIFHNWEEVKTGEIKPLVPVEYGPYRLVLTRFFATRDEICPQVGVAVNIVNAPFTGPFICLYLLLIGLMAWYVVGILRQGKGQLI